MTESSGKWPPKTQEEVLEFFGSTRFQDYLNETFDFLKRSAPGFRQRDLVEDAVMETLAVYLEKRTDPETFNYKQFDEPLDFCKYFFKSCHNKLVDEIRKLERRRRELQEWIEEESSAKIVQTSVEDTESQSVRDELIRLLRGPFSDALTRRTGLTRQEHEVLSLYLGSEAIELMKETGKKGDVIQHIMKQLGLRKRTTYRRLESAKLKIQRCLASSG